MADPNRGQRVAQAWDAYIAGKPEDVINDDYGQLRRMEKNKKAYTGGGDNIIGAIEYKLNSSTAWISDTEALAVERVDVFDEYNYVWRQLGETVVMSSFETAINRGSSAKFDLLAGKLENARSSMRSVLNASLFTAQTGKAILGFPDLMSTTPSTGGVLGGINRTTYSFWRNQQTSGARTTTPYDNLRAAMRTIHSACSKGQGVKEPEYYVGTSTDVNGFESLLIANERITSKDDKDAEGGFKSTAFRFKMAQVVWDRDQASATMHVITKDNPKLIVQAGYWFKGYPAVDPANQLLDVFKIETICQLVTGNPRHLGVITVID